MARYQIQSNTGNGWRDEPTNVYAKSNRQIAIAGAKVVDAEGRAFGRPALVRIARVGRWTGDFKEVVWKSY